MLTRDADTIEGRVPADATLETLLRDNGVQTDLISSMVTAVRTVFNPRELRADRVYRLTRSLDGLFREFSYQIDADRLLRVIRHDGKDDAEPQFDADVVPLPKQVTAEAVSADVTRDRPSLVAALSAGGERVQLALLLADVYSGEVDFNSDLQPGDHVDVLFDRETRDGEFLGYGGIDAATLQNGGRTVTAIRFVGPDGKPGWYDEHGQSLRRQFLRSPLPFEPRITSGFSYRRLHPIYGTYRAHLGVDYGAPVGTAVIAVADGVVESAGWAGEAGRMVELRHGGGYETLYLHLSSFAPGIHPGVRVTQGDLVGRVGQSGAATGPHLDYRIKKNGTYVNPLVEISRMPAAEPIAADLMDAFRQERDRVLGQMRALLPAPAPNPSASNQ